MTDPNSPRRLHPLERKPDYDPYAEMEAPPRPRPSFMQLVRQSPVTWALIAVNCVVFLLGALVPGLDRQLVTWGANQGQAIWGEGQAWRLLTSTFLHGGLIHLAFNMLTLQNIGAAIERFYRTGRLLALYFASGLGGALLSALLNDPRSLSVGASGAVLGLVAADLAMVMRVRYLSPQHFDRQLRGSALYLAMLIGIGFLPGSIIDNWGHIGGLVTGALLSGYYLRGRLGQHLERVVRRNLTPAG